ncbi:MAG: LuxR C-terminal-related transcriptional regulator [Proteobacteria bacterium]|nr:LuxR C-terminal-related transcriptional regulator [Pseudomonadota bacterium]
MSSLLGEDCSIALVSAPAGFGKTTMLSEWAHNHDFPVAWVSLESSENNPMVFWCYLFTAMDSVLGPRGQKALSQITSSQSLSIETILIGLINDLADDDRVFSLVLDDYHVISHQDIHKSMEFFLDHLPRNMRIILSGRDEPRLCLSKFRISGKLREIRAEDLRFRDDEAEQLLNGIHGLALGKTDVLSLKKKTEGWAAGLALAILSIKDQQDKHAFIEAFTGSHRLVLDYLMEEVLSGLGQDMREFMLKVSTVDRFCPSLCRAISGYDDSARMVKEMEANNLFLIPLDDQRQWFRFHHLFREVLLKALRERVCGDIRPFHVNAFIWFRDHGYEMEAFNHGILAEQFDEAANLLADHAPEQFSEYGGFMLNQLLSRLPSDIVFKNPDLCSYQVMLNVMAGSFERAPLLYQDHFKGNPTVQGFKSLIQSYYYFYRSGEFEKCIEEISVMLDVLPKKHVTVREMGDLLLCLSLRYNGEIETAYERMSSIPWDENIPVLKAISYADILMGMGKIDSALVFITKSIAWGKARYGENLVSEYAYLYIQKGSILREKNQVDDALKACRHGLYLGRNDDYIEFVFIGNMEYARALAANHDYAEATKAINRSLAAARSSATWGVNLTAAYKIRIELAKGNIARAEALVKDLGDFSAQEIPFYTSNETLSFCRLCLCKKQTKQVHDITDTMICEDEGRKRNARLLECYVLKALAFQVDQRMDEALAFLEKAFTLSARDGYVRIFLDEGEPMMTLLKQARKRNILPDYLKPYLLSTGHDHKDRTVMIHEFKERFNEREIDILKLMKKGSSNKMIAETLFLSVHTVRWYASRIFAKLNVKRRGEAVVHAEKYDLI